MTWTTSSTAVSALADQARRFAEEVRDLLSETVCESPVLELEEMSSRERLSVIIRSSKNTPLHLNVCGKLSKNILPHLGCEFFLCVFYVINMGIVLPN